MAKRAVSVQALLASLTQRRAALPAEIGCFAVLEAVESMRRSRPARLDPSSVMISDEGQVTLAAPPTDDERLAVQSAASLLSALLSAAARPPTPQLARLAAAESVEYVVTLGAMRDELEAALVPLNRQASRRVLARMVREMEWSVPPPALAPAQALSGDAAATAMQPPVLDLDVLPSLEDLDSELHRLLRDSGPAPEDPAAPTVPTIPPAPIPRITIPDRDLEDLDAHLRSTAWGSVRDAAPETLLPRRAAVVHEGRALASAAFGAHEVEHPSSRPLGPDTVPVPPPAAALARAASRASAEDARAPARPASVPPAAPASLDLPLGSSVPQGRSRAGLPRTFTSEPPPSSGKGVWFGLGLTALSLLVVGSAFWLRPDLLSKLDGRAPEAAPLADSLPVAPAVRAGDITLRVDVPRAQILRFAGRGPAVLRHAAVGVAHELVAASDGFAPARLVVPADAEWEKGEVGLRFEAALQLSPQTGPVAEFGASLLPHDVGTPTGRYGELRVVTTPKGAKVYELVGFAPEARIEDVRIDDVHEFMFVAEGHEPVVRVISPSDFVAEGVRARAELTVALPKRPGVR
jgi:hypothetical protein